MAKDKTAVTVFGPYGKKVVVKVSADVARRLEKQIQTGEKLSAQNGSRS